MQNRTDSGILRFSKPQPNMDVPLNDIAIKVHIYRKYEIKVKNFFRFVVCFQYFKFSFNELIFTCVLLSNWFYILLSGTCQKSYLLLKNMVFW